MKINYQNTNPRRAMKVSDKTRAADLNSSGKKRVDDWNHLLCNPFSRIPDVRKFCISVREMDALFARYHLNKRTGPAKIKIIPFKNREMNRYILHQVKRLNAAVDSPDLFWTIAQAMIFRSNCFLLTAVNHCLPQWQRMKSLAFVMATIRRVRKLQERQETFIDFKRVYLPKGETWRPLGVPKKEWIIHLHLYAQFLAIYCKDRISTSQHGFMPGRGTLSAWRELLSSIHYKWIYEFDFKGFFDKLKTDKTYEVMVKWGIPEPIAKYLYAVNCSIPILPGSHLLDESRFYLENGLTLQSYVNAFRDNMVMVNGRWIHPARMGGIPRGVPQGSPVSPIISAMVLQEYLYSRVKVVGYADDGLMFSDTAFDPHILLNQPDVGLEEKASSGWVKLDGAWIKDIKFLGKVFSWRDGKIRSETRSGKSLELDKRELMAEYDLRDGIYHPDGRPSWEIFMKSKIAGWIQSRLYIGEWSSERIQQEFEYWYNKGSWSDFNRFRDKESRTVLDVFNSSSVASGWLVKRLKPARRKSTPYCYLPWKMAGGELFLYKKAVQKLVRRTPKTKP